MRANNLIQSYVNTHPANQQYKSDKAAKNFDVQKELSNRTFIKPLSSNGKLLKPSLFDTPSEIARGFKYNFKSFVHALKGEANDHELGRLNDVGMKLGGLGIATYLLSRKQTSKAKLFEFVGLASFFAAMDIWPKLFLQLPAKLIHGVDVRQKYEDSFGRKKMFYQDHQFIPWDLYSEKEINKIGDRMKVPKDIPNRREFIQEKMRKIALQNNTMWMLTSGFATPIMSALICNALEKPVEEFLYNRKDAKTKAMLTNFNQEAMKYDYSERTQHLQSVLDANRGKPLSEALVNEIEAVFTKDMDPTVAKAVKFDLAKDFDYKSAYNITDETIDNLHSVLKTQFASQKVPEAVIEKLLPNKEVIVEIFRNEGILNVQTSEFSNQTKAIYNLLEQNINTYLKDNPDSKMSKRLNFALTNLLHTTEKSEPSVLEQVFSARTAKILSDNLVDKIRNLNDIFVKFDANTNVLAKFAHEQVGQAEHTMLADIWNNTSENIYKALKFTPEEIRTGKLDREFAGQVLRNKMEAITSDKQAFDGFLNEMRNVLAKMYSQTAAMSVDNDNNLYKSLVANTFDNAKNDLQTHKMGKTIETLLGYDAQNKASLKQVYLDFVSDRITGVRSSFYRFLELSHLYYKVSQKEGLDGVLDGRMLREVKEELVELAKSTLLGGHTSDFAVKLTHLRNTTPNAGDTSQIEVKNGKVINKYLNETPNGEKFEVPHDKVYFSKVMDMMYGGDIHPDVENKLKNEVFFEDYKSFRRIVYEKLGGEKYFAFPHVLLHGREYGATSFERFNRLGCAPDEFMFKLFNNKFNSKTWFSKFGKLGAGVAGVTLASQFFFGRMKTPQVQKEAS